MSAFEDALEADRDRRPSEAIEAYGRVLLGPDEEATRIRLAGFNLAALYYQANDFGFATAHKLPDELTRNGALMALGVLRIVAHRVGATDEGTFWEEMIIGRCFTELDPERWRRLAREHPNSLLLNLGMMLTSPESAQVSLLDTIVSEAESERTVRAEYLKSIAEAARKSRLT